jgi:hypothetical protein
VRISEGLGVPTDLKVTFPSGATLNIVYKPTSYTMLDIERLEKESKKSPRRIIDAIRRLVLKWDLTDDGGQPVPLEAPASASTVVVTGDSLKTVQTEPESDDDPLLAIPTIIFMYILRAVNEDQNPGN